MSKNNRIYSEITEAILKKIEGGFIPWQKPWKGGLSGQPKSFISKKAYRSINTIILGLAGFNSSWWLTYNQAREKGGFVKKGARGTKIIFWNFIEKKTGKTDSSGQPEKENFPLLREYTVFNVEQTEGITTEEAVVEELKPFQKLAEAEKINNGFLSGPEVIHDGYMAFYHPGDDTITLPYPESFKSSEEYYSTLFHEYGHCSGASKRLGRSGIVGRNYFGSSEYSKEELIAEFTSAFLCGHCGIDRTLSNSAAYIQSWLKVLKANSNWLIKSAQAAQKAADYILEEVAQVKEKRLQKVVTEIHQDFGEDSLIRGVYMS